VQAIDLAAGVEAVEMAARKALLWQRRGWDVVWRWLRREDSVAQPAAQLTRQSGCNHLKQRERRRLLDARVEEATLRSPLNDYKPVTS